MKIAIRRNVFETNSSSAHAFAFRKKDDPDYSAFENAVNKNKLTKITDPFDIMIVVVSSIDVELFNCIRDVVEEIEDLIPEDKKLSFYEYIELFAPILESGDCKTIARKFKETGLVPPEIMRDFNYNEYKNGYIDDASTSLERDDYDVFFSNSYSTKEFIDYWNYRKRAVELYAEKYGKYRYSKKGNDEIISLSKTYYTEQYYMCQELFCDGPLSDCNCYIEDLIIMVSARYTIDDLLESLFKGDLSIYCCEECAKSFCLASDRLS